MKKTTKGINESSKKTVKDCAACPADAVVKVNKYDKEAAGKQRMPYEILTQIMTAYLLFLGN